VTAISRLSEPAVSVVEIDDPATANAGLELIDQDLVQLEPMPLKARRITVHLDSAHVVFHSSNVRARTRTRVHAGLIAFVTFGMSASGTVNALAIRPDMLLAAEAEAEANFVVNAGWESITVLLPPQDISVHLAARQRDKAFSFPHGVETLLADPAKVGALFDWSKRLTDTAARQPELFNGRPNERRSAQVELLETLLSALHVASDVELTRNERTRQTYSEIVKTIEEFAMAHTGDHLYVSDLCRVAAASERTLEYACQEIMGLTPMAYLTRLRLHRVRQALHVKTQGNTTVSTEALNWGFWHFGEFSRLYKDCFGELPSHTLRRKPDPQSSLPSLSGTPA
jgi:AraC family transcriptional regulator, ethanolamine operon transcriptional activator